MYGPDGQHKLQQMEQQNEIVEICTFLKGAAMKPLSDGKKCSICLADTTSI